MLEHRCELCTTIAPVRSYAHAHIIPPDTRSEEGATLKHDGADLTHRHQAPALSPGSGSHPWPDSDLWRLETRRD